VSEAEELPLVARLSPGSPEWAARLNELRDLKPTPRRAAVFRLAAAVREIIDRMVHVDATVEEIEDAALLAEQLRDLLRTHGARSIYESFAEAANAGEPMGFFDHSPILGQANPLAPPVTLSREDDRIVGRVTFGAAYEGPPGCVHGGYIAAAFDEVLGAAQSLGGDPGMTGRLTIHYRSPTPLHEEVRFEGLLESVRGRKILTKGTLHHGDRLCAEAEGLFVTVNMERFAEMLRAKEERAAGSG